MKAVTAVRANLSLITLFLLFAVGLTWLSLLNADNSPVLHAAKLTSAQSTILLLAVIIPYIGILLTGLVGYMRLRDYVGLIRESDDGIALRMIARGILGVLITLPITSLFNSAAQAIDATQPDRSIQIRLIGVYLSIVVLLWAFYQLVQGTRALVVKSGRLPRTMPRLVVVTYLLLGGVYIYFVLTNPAFINGHTRGYLPSWLIIDSIVLPRLLAWYWGIHAAWSLYQYAQQVAGRIYRLAFSYLALGLGVVTLSIILLQYVQAISAVSKLPLAVVLLVVYGVLVVVSAGFMLLARGGKELRKIEEV